MYSVIFILEAKFYLSDELKRLKDELLLNELPGWSRTRDIEQAVPAETFNLDSDIENREAGPVKGTVHYYQTLTKSC